MPAAELAWLRVVAPNPGPMTLEGTNSYVVGPDRDRAVYVIDPGPADPRHIAALRAAAEARGELAGSVLTHSHADHSAGVELLGAPLLWGAVSVEDETSGEHPGAAPAASPRGATGVRVGPLEVMPTPGHATDHVCLLAGATCFCGDIVLGHGSSFVPPDGGSLAAYLDSLRRLRQLELGLLLPGHGPPIDDPRAKLDEYLEHRLEREHRLLAALERGVRDREELLAEAWSDVPEVLRPAAALVMQAHLEKLAAEGRLPDDAAT